MTLTPIMLYCQEEILKRLYNREDIYNFSYDFSLEELQEPLTLPRVLTALGELIDNKTIKVYHGNLFTDSKDRPIFVWNYLNKDKTDATLFDQTIETIEAIGKLLGYNE